jgi:hypothetical protein
VDSFFVDLTVVLHCTPCYVDSLIEQGQVDGASDVDSQALADPLFPDLRDLKCTGRFTALFFSAECDRNVHLSSRLMADCEVMSKRRISLTDCKGSAWRMSYQFRKLPRN